MNARQRLEKNANTFEGSISVANELLASDVDAVVEAANKWADHFGSKLLQNRLDRDSFIANYIARSKEKRFWTISGTVAGVDVTACRLGSVLLFFDGFIVKARKVKAKNANLAYRWENNHSGYCKVKLPLSVPTETEIHSLLPRLNTSFSAVDGCKGIFETLTTFSKEFQELVSNELRYDLGFSVNEEKSKDVRFAKYKRRFYNCLGASVLKEFCSRLNQAALRTVRSVGCPSLLLYNWIASGDVLRRIQAVKAYPLLLPYMLLSSKKDHDYSDRPHADVIARFGTIVDEGKQPNEFLADWYSCSPKAIKAAATFPIHHTGSVLSLINHNGWEHRFAPIMRATLLGNRKPKCKAEWKVWWRVDEMLSYVLPCNAYSQNADLASFFSGCPDWASEEWRGLIEQAKDFNDVGFTNIYDTQKKLNFRQLLNVSLQWHDCRAKLHLELMKSEGIEPVSDPSWSAMLPTGLIHQDTGVSIVELLLPKSLNEEASALYHCVDGYAQACYSGRSRIVSFRKGSVSLATAEYCLEITENKPTVKRLYCAQLRGYENAHISLEDDAGKAEKWLFSSIKKGLIKVSIDWPNVPVSQQPSRMQKINSVVDDTMNTWLAQKLGGTVYDH